MSPVETVDTLLCLLSDYVGFIKKVMKQMQQPKYNQMKKIDVDLSPLEHTESGPPLSPGTYPPHLTLRHHLLTTAVRDLIICHTVM